LFDFDFVIGFGLNERPGVTSEV